jgi:VWFA-related protein
LASYLLLLSLFLPAQVPKKTPTIKTTTRLVQVSVVVQDKNGEPVRDLTREDFAIYDEGKSQEISTFAKMTDEPQANLALLPPGVVSNRLAYSAGSGTARLTSLPDSITVILIDGLNTTRVNQYYSKEALIKFLQQIQPGKQVAIYALNNGLRVLHDFSSDKDSLLAALNRYNIQGSFRADASIFEPSSNGKNDMPVAIGDSVDLDSMMDTINERITSYYDAQRLGEITAEALTTIADHMSGMPGRKNIVWLSSSFPTILGRGERGVYGEDFRTFDFEMQRALRVINDTGVAIYPVDAQGLIVGNFSADAIKPPATAFAFSNTFKQLQFYMAHIAERTGGKAFLNTNEITGSIRKAMDDTRFSYVLGYIPNGKWDGTYHNIKLKLKRPNLEARYRQGYFARPELPKTNSVREQILKEALNSPLLATGLGVTAKIAVTPTADRHQTTINAMLDAHELPFAANDKGEREANLDLIATVFDDQRQSLSQIVRIAHFSMKPEQLDQALQTGLKLDVEVNAPAKSDHIRLVFRDMESGALGSVDIPLKGRTEENSQN